MSPSNSKSLRNCESTLCIQNNNGKRSFFKTLENDVTDYDIYSKRKKPIKHSEVDINNAVLAASGGYMTRNRLSKQLTNNSELEEANITEDKCSKTDNLGNKSENGKNNNSARKVSQNKLQLDYAKKNKKSARKISQNKLQLGYVFTHDISLSYPGKQLSTEYKKSTPSLFESDSDPEFEDFQIKYATKNEVKNISTCISNSDIICPAFDKNIEMKTYFNKKSYTFNNKSNIKSLNTFEKSNQESSTLSNNVKLNHDSNPCQSILQNSNKRNKSLTVTDSKTSECVQKNTEDDNIIIVTDSFIRELNNEFQIVKTNSQGISRTQVKIDDTSTNKCNASNIERHKDNELVSEVLSLNDEVNQNNICTIDTNIDDICDINTINFNSSISSDLLIKQDMDVINKLDKSKLLPFKTTNTVEDGFLSIFDVPKDNTLVENNVNINDTVIGYSDSNTSTSISDNMIELNSLQTYEFDYSSSDQCIENHLMSKKKISSPLLPDQTEPNLVINQYFHTAIKDEIKLTSDNFNSRNNHDFLLKNNSSSFTKDNYSKKHKNLYSKCYCENFSSFNHNDNKILTSKIKHFAFNNYAKKVRQKILRQKHLEANILKILITKEHKHITQSKEHLPIFNSTPINIRYEKCVQSTENDHIKPNILTMLKDVYVDIEYLTEYCDHNTSDISFHNSPESGKKSKDNKINFQASEVKPIQNICLFKEDNDSISNNATKNKPIILKPCDENYVNFNINKIIDKSFTSNDITKKKPVNLRPCDGSYVNFNKNKIVDDGFIYNNTTKNKQIHSNFKPHDGNGVNFDKNKIIDNASTLNNITKKKSTYLKPCNKNDVNFNINKIIDNASTSNSKTKKNPVNINLCDEICVNFNKKDMIDSSLTSNCSTKNKSIHVKSCDENIFNLNITKIIDNCMSNSTTKKKSINFKQCDKSDILIDYETNNSIKKTDSDCDTVYKSHVVNANFDSTSLIKVEDCLNYGITDTKYNLKPEKGFEMKQFDIHQPNDNTLIINKNNNSNEKLNISEVKSSDIESENILSFTHTSNDENKTVPALIESEKEPNMLKIFEPPQYKNLVYTCSNADQICSMLPDISKPPVKNVFNLPIDDISFSFNNSSSDDDRDDDNRLMIEDAEINTLKDEQVSNSILPVKKISISDDYHENLCVLKEENNSIDDCMSIKMCNEFYKIKTLNKSIVKKNESLPKNIQDILKEMYVDELFVTTCQHMVEMNNDGQLKNNVFLQTNGCKNLTSEKFVCDVINENVEKNIYSEFDQSIPTNVETLSIPEISFTNQKTNKPSNFTTDVKKSLSLHKTNDVKKIYPELIQSTETKTILNKEINNCNQGKKLSNPGSKTQNSGALQKSKNTKSNIKIRIHLREFVKSNIPLNEIVESKEFKNFKFFGEEEIASSISVFIFEHTIEPPIITGLSIYKVNYDQLKNEEKNKILTSTNLNITCPKIMKLTSISLALVKMLRSDTLIETILNVIRNNVLKKQMNIDHTIDSQLIKQILYFVDICVRLRLLKTLQIFIFDSMVFLPNKYCCIIFISLLLWKNCLPRSINNEEDPVIIIVMSYLIAKKKLYSEETVGCDIFQRELINLLSCHFNYKFSIDVPTNFIQHIHKPDFFVSVVMFLKCCNPKDLTEFMVNCLFPILENYLNTQQNETYAMQTMESIIMSVKPFKVACNSTVATYLKKCKDPINSAKTNGKEHIYNTIYNSYKILQNKFIEYLNDSRPRSQYFEESLVSIILMLGSVDYLNSCMSLMQWKPKFEVSAILSKKILMFKSIIGHIVWDKLCAIDDIKTLKCMVNSCVLNKDVHNTIIRMHALR